MLDIAFIEGPVEEFGERAMLGELTLGNYKERFYAPLIYWSADDYRNHWTKAAGRVVSGLEAAFFVRVYNPLIANFLEWWPMYPEGQFVYAQNHLLFLDQLDGPLDITDPWRHIGPRNTESEDGEKTSEWQLSMKDIEAFSRRLRSQVDS